MWNKITNGNALIEGLTINQYPVEGNPVNVINLSDGRNLLTYQVAAIDEVDGPNDVIHLMIPTVEGPDIPEKTGLKIMETLGNTAAIQKLRKEFAEENSWWTYTIG